MRLYSREQFKALFGWNTTMCVTSDILIGIIPFCLLFSHSLFAGIVGGIGVFFGEGLDYFLLTIYALINLVSSSAWVYLTLYRKTRNPSFFTFIFGFSALSHVAFLLRTSYNVERSLLDWILGFGVILLISILYAKHIFMLSRASEVQP